METLVMASTSAPSPNSSAPNLLDHFSALPTEVKSQIVDLLPAKSRVHLRLMSRKFAVLCADRMFQDGVFVVRPRLDQDDIMRLESISLHPAISKGISHLKLIIRDISLSKFASTMSEWQLSEDAMEELYQVIDEMDNDGFTTPQCERDLLERIFPRLPNLIAVTAISEYPWGSGAAELIRFCQSIGRDFDPGEIFDGESRFQDAILSTNQYTDILLTAKTIQKPLQRLVLKPIPIDCWAMRNADGEHTREVVGSEDVELYQSYKRYVANEDDEGNGDYEVDKDIENQNVEEDHDFGENQDGDDSEDGEDETNDEHEEEWDMILDPSKQKLFQTVVADITDLQIALTAHGRQYDDLNLARALGQFFGCMINLRSLDLQCLMLWGTDVPVNNEWMDTFYANTWPHLESLKLRDMETYQSKQPRFLAFLRRHISMLRRLHLSNTWIVAESSLLPILKNDFKLDNFEFLNNSRREAIYDANWEPICAASNPWSREIWRLAKLQELYVLGKFEWPLTGYYLSGRSAKSLREGFKNVSDDVIAEILEDHMPES